MVVAEVKALACALPAETGTPLSRWSCPELAREAVHRGITEQVSASTIRRWLAEDALKPWQHRSWIFPRDPDFAVKAARVLDLYAGIWDGEPLSDKDFVVCADEKTSIQARCRCHPSLPPGKARMMRIEHEYARGGALAYLAAWEVHRGHVQGGCEPRSGIEPFGRLVNQVMTSEPYASAHRVFWVVDNGSSHRGQAAADRLSQKWPNARLVHLPVHASWLDQIEIYFSIVQRKVVQRPHRPRRRRTAAARLLRPLQADRDTILLEIHPQRPRRPARPHRHPRTRQPTTNGRMSANPRRNYDSDH
jgi:hypothetical protein